MYNFRAAGIILLTAISVLFCIFLSFVAWKALRIRSRFYVCLATFVISLHVSLICSALIAFGTYGGVELGSEFFGMAAFAFSLSFFPFCIIWLGLHKYLRNGSEI